MPETPVARSSYSAAEFARRHGVSEATVRRWIAEGVLPSVKINKTRRITRAQEAAFLEAHVASGHSPDHSHATEAAHV